MSTITGTTINSGITLSTSGAYTSPLTITNTGAVEFSSGYAIYGPGNAGGTNSWTIDNAGTISGIRGIKLGASGLTVTASSITNESGGYIYGSGYGIEIYGSGTITNASGGVINSGSYGTAIELISTGDTLSNSGTIIGNVALQAGGVVNNNGTIFRGVGAVGTASVTITNSGTIAHSNGDAILAPGGTIVNSGVILGVRGAELDGSGTIIDSGTIAGGIGGSVFFAGTGSHLLELVGTSFSLTGYVHGSTAVGATNTLELGGTVGAAVSASYNALGLTNFQDVLFGSGGYDSLKVSNVGGTLPVTISGFDQTSEIIDLTGIGTNGTISFQSSTLVTVTGSLGSETLKLDATDGTTFTVTSDNLSGTELIACFTRGTGILTPAGEVAVEDLAIGDKVVTHSCEAKPVKWIGRRAYDGRFIAGNKAVLPIRIMAGALADGVPSRDLRVSPEHALYLDGMLVPAACLVNGVMIVQEEAVDQVEYFHIELDRHDIIVADGTPAESYVDCDNRLMFANAGEYHALYPGERPVPFRFCAPRLGEGSLELAAILSPILARAGLLPPEPTPEEDAERLPNAGMSGVAIGPLDDGGALPSGWAFYGAAGLRLIVGSHGSENGVDWLDLRLRGTPTATTNHNQIFFAGRQELAVAAGERWLVTARVALAGGSLANVRAIEVGANLNDESGEYCGWFGASSLLPHDEPLAARRFGRAAEINQRSAAYLMPLIQIAVIEGRPVDLTLRIGQAHAAPAAAHHRTTTRIASAG